jgi:lethal(2) giant larvae protein
LIVLLEEDLVAYDLTDKNYAQMTIPYLHSLHASAVTCNHLVSQVTAEVYEKIHQAGRQQLINFSTSGECDGQYIVKQGRIYYFLFY